MSAIATVFAQLLPGVRGVQPIVIYQGKDISQQVYPTLRRVQWRQIYADGFDTFSLQLVDPTGRFAASWTFQRTQPLTLKIRTQNWRFPGDNQLVTCGTFLIDEIIESGPPQMITIKASPGAAQSKAKWSNYWRMWSGTLKSIATQIAKEIGYKCTFLNVADVPVAPTAQENCSDLVFLSQLCRRYFYSMKVSGDTIYIFNEMDLDAHAPSFSIVKPRPGLPGGTGMGVNNWSLTASQQYNNFVRPDATGNYVDPFTGKVIGTETGKTIDITGQEPTSGISAFPTPKVTQTKRPLLPHYPTIAEDQP